MTCLLISLLLLAALILFHSAIEHGASEDVEKACMVLIGAVLVAFLAWFVLYGPTPDYLPPYGTGTQPIEMRD